MMMRKLGFLLTVSLLLAGCVNKPPKPDNPYYAPVEVPRAHPAAANTGAIYNPATNVDFYGDGRAHRVGDVIIIVLSESTQSSKSASTSVEKSSDINLPQPTIAGRGLTINGNPVSAGFSGANTEFDGEGSADMSNSLNGNIAVTVHEVLPNGLLVVRGEKWLTLNQGDEYIRVSGLVRPQDIGPDNSVISTRLADARITYSGTGSVHNSNAIGWLSKFFLSPLWPL